MMRNLYLSNNDQPAVRYLLFIISIILSHFCRAQSQEISLRHFNTASGLSDNNIRCILFDSKGFMWLGTSEGLNRFDGKEFTVIKRTGAKKFSLSGNVITDIIEDHDGTFWVATRDGGICNINTTSGEVSHPILPIAGGGEQNYVHCVLQKDDGQIFVGTDKGIYRSINRTTFELLPKCGVLACYDLENYHEKILAAVNVGGLCEITSDSLISCDKDRVGVYPSPAHSLNDLFIDEKNNCWVAAWDNFLHQYIPDQKKINHLDFLKNGKINYTADEIRSVTEVTPGKLWLAMKSNAMYEYEIASGVSSLIHFSKRETAKLNGQRIFFLYTDKLFRTWIGTDNGLHLYDPEASKFNVVSIDHQPIVTDFIEENDRIIFSSTAGVFSIQQNSSAFFPLGDGLRNVYSICATPNYLVAGTNTSLNKLKPENEKFVPISPVKRKYLDLQQLTSSRFNKVALVHLSNKELILASAYGHGIVILDPASGEWNLCDGITQDGIENLARDIFQDSKGRVWILGSNGPARFDYMQSAIDYSPLKEDEFLSPLQPVIRLICTAFNKNLLSKEITSMCEMRDGTFWVSTQGAGLYHFDPENLDHPFESVNSPAQSMQEMVMDNNGDLWIVAAGGLLHYQTSKNNWTRYSDRDGIPADGLSGALFVASSGEVYAGGNGFFLRFHPDKMSVKSEIPSPVITHLSIMDVLSDSLLTNETITLPYDQNFISIDFASLCFSDPTSVVYHYKLDGLDENWRDNGNNNKVSYSALAPGEYTFHVKAQNVGSADNSKEAIINFRILQPYYLRWWFIAVMSGFLLFGVWLFIRFRSLQQQKLASVRNKIARDLHDDIGSALGSISFFSETAKRTLHDQNNDGTNHVLNKIGSTSREMIENMHDIVWAVNPDNDSFSHVLNRMKSYAADMAAANHIHLHFYSAPELVSLKLSMDERKNTFLIFKEAIYNSCKYSNCSELTITMKKETGHRFVLIIQDDGSGFDLQKTSDGNGLRNMKSRALEIHGEYEIHSETAKGTTIRLTL